MKLIRSMTVDDAALVSSNVTENDYAAYSGATTYALGDRVIVVSTDVHLVYESLQGSNLNHTPASSPTWWLEVGATNRWKMFDVSVNAQTSNADSIAVTLQADGRVDSVALFNVSALSVQVTMTDATEGVVYDQTTSLVADSGIQDWYSWFFEPIVRKSDFLAMDLPPYADAQIAVTLTASGETVTCGELVLGLSKAIGDTQYGASLGIQDYSIKTRDDFGNAQILERAFSRRAAFTVWLPSGFTDELHRLLSDYRATPVVYVGDDGFTSSAVYGFFKDFAIEIAYDQISICTIEIEGLT